MTTEKCDAPWCDVCDITPWKSQCSNEGTERCWSGMQIKRSKEKKLKKKELIEINEWLEVKVELLREEVAEFEAKYIELQKAAIAIKLATTIEGKKPKRHKKTMFNHRIEWPYLWKRIDELIKVADRR
jgi:hypothetical protein